MKAKVLYAVICCLWTSVLYAQATPKTVEWGYKGNIGPSRWAELSPDFILCADGKSQSPINIPPKTETDTSALIFNYTSAPLYIMKDGDTALTMGSREIVINDGHSVQLNFGQETSESIIFDNTAYRLVELHFHAPSETTLLGLAFPLEIHFVHQNDQGEIAIIAVFAKGGAEHSEIQTIVDHIPPKRGLQYRVKGKTINPDTLLPDNRSFFTYAGSLTIPPCYEGVRWIVMATPIAVSPAQIALIKQAVGGNNARPVQRLNNRPVLFVPNGVKSVP